MTGRTEYILVTTIHKYSDHSEHTFTAEIQVSENAGSWAMILHPIKQKLLT